MSQRNDNRFNRRNFNSNRDYRPRNDRREPNENQVSQNETPQPSPKKEVKTENMASISDQSGSKANQKKFTGRCRLYVGNLPNSMVEEDFKKMFEPYGEMAEVFLSAQKGFGFVKLDTRHNAETAKAALDGTLKEGRVLKVKFASNGAAVKVKNLSPWVTNELLENAFSYFGEVERAVVVVNDRGRPVGEGIVEFAKKNSAVAAIKKCTQECFLLSSCPRPVTVDPIECRDEEDGFPEKMVPRNNPELQKDREMGPRFAEHGTFEYEYADRWKKLYTLEAQKKEFLEKEIQDARRQLEEEMEFTYYDHEANMLREKLRRLEEQTNMMQRNREMRLEEYRRFDDQIRQTEMILRDKEEEILRPRVTRNAQGVVQNLPAAPPSQNDLGADLRGPAVGGYDMPPPGVVQYPPPNQLGAEDQMYGKRPYQDHGGYPDDIKRRRY